MKTMLGILGVISALILGGSAVAEKKDEQKAVAAFQKGIAAYKKGDMDAAVEAFRRADALHPSWKIHYNIGQCEAALRRYGPAIEAFEQYVGQGGDEIPKERQDEVLTELDRMRRMVGTLVIKGQPGVDIYVDIVKYGNTSNKASIQVTAGVSHEISFVKDGKKLGSVNLVVSGGQVVEVPVDSQGTAALTVSVPPPATPVVVSPSVPVSAPSKYTNMLQIKTALKEGKITKAAYQGYQKEIRADRQAEYDALKADLRAGKITEREYETEIAACRKKYEGQ